MYCVVAILTVKDMRKMDFYLVFLQSAFDCLTSGLFNAIYNFFMILNQMEAFCGDWKLLKHVYEKDIPKQFDIYIKPELLLCTFPNL